MEPFAVFLDSLDEGARSAWARAERRAVFDAALARLAAAAPEVEPAALARAFARAASKAADDDAALARTHLEDLAVSAAALEGRTAALDRVEEAVVAASASVARTMRLGPGEVDEAAQVARVKLLVRVGAGEPSLARYSGAGPLRAFVASVLGQEAVRLRQKASRERPGADLSEIVLPQLLGSAGSGPFLESFRQAFHAALAALDARERTVLRLTVLDALTADEVGAGYRVHRVTVARWLRQIREQLLAETRRHLAADLALTGSGLDALIDTHLAEVDVSLSRVLREPDGGA